MRGEGLAGRAVVCRTEAAGQGCLGRDQRSLSRTIEIVHHVYEDEESKLDLVREGLRDSSREEGLEWAGFYMSCRTAAGWLMESHRLNSGDL